VQARHAGRVAGLVAGVVGRRVDAGADRVDARPAPHEDHVVHHHPEAAASRRVVVQQLTHTHTHTHTVFQTDPIYGRRCNLLLAGLMGQYYFAGWRLSSSVVVCNAAGVRTSRPPGEWEHGVRTLPAVGPPGRRARGRSGFRHCTAGQCGYVPLGRHLVFISSA